MKALITGITGQDGSYLAEYLLFLGYDIYGLIRHVSGRDLWRLDSVRDSIKLMPGDLTDYDSVANAIYQVKPDEIYNLAAQTFVGRSWHSARAFMNTNGIGAFNVFEAARVFARDARIYQASSSEMFGIQPDPQDEQTSLCPESPYGASKVFAHNMANIFRNSYKMHIACGIAFNHESPRRGNEFVSKKISRGAALIGIHGKSAPKIRLGRLDAQRDWGFAGDYVVGMHQILQQPSPRDYVLATGVSHTVEDWLASALEYAGIPLEDVKDYVEIDPVFTRPSEIYALRGNYERIKYDLGWAPTMGFHNLVELMYQSEYDRIKAKINDA